ncbi:MAG TPA: type VI secretion system baseplate subunit TssF [Gemmatimonas sp.]|uniref:type VI secretion system baseplate subunit TssF n=1 Tax=Gemmatimonas sp. TaxID=1962908 RepID=UPI002EDB150A
MQDDLLLYYERELTYLRKLGAEFAQQYPKVASRLQLEANRCEDPHVERLLEGFAFLAARIHRRLDDDFPEISESLLEMLHPQLVRPLPSMAIVEIALDPAQGRAPEGFQVPRGSVLHTKPVNGVPCVFRTNYDTTLYPLRIAGAEWTTPDRAGAGAHGREAVAAVRLNLQAFNGVTLESLKMDALRVHISADSSVADTLYELLANNCVQVVVRNPDRPSAPPIVLGSRSIQPVGFGPDEAMLPQANRSFAGYSLLQELFTFPEKFHFLDIVGVGDALRRLGATERAEIGLLIGSFERTERRQALELGVSARTFRLGCTPVVNLFSQSAEPILLSERSYEHLVVPDARRRLEVEVWSVDSVQIIEHTARQTRQVAPLYSHRHGLGPDSAEGGELFWQSIRRTSGWRTDRGTDVHLSFSDLSGQLRMPDQDVASVHVTCSNGDMPSRLPFGTDERGDFELVSGGPIQRISAIVNPTRAIQPKLGKSLLWRLISSLSLNHLSLADEGGDSLRELLRLHNVTNSLSFERQIDGIIGVRTEPSFARVTAAHGMTFARGRRIELDFDEDLFPGGGMYLLASVLERFFALYASMNSFTRVAVRSKQRRRQVVEWPPRAGWRALL